MSELKASENGLLNELIEIVESDEFEELCNSIDSWKTLLVDYHPPIVERLYTKIGNYRVSLHCIHPCEVEEALLHPHPWKSAFMIIDGDYRTGIGYSETEEVPKILSETIVTGQGFRYDMIDPNLWHYVAPITPVLTIMINDEPFDKDEMNPACKKATKELHPLSEERKQEILEKIQQYLF